ncbi:hypothetical protein IPJ72_05235 [Candidatus Peregrinibacteria bacterium]|nr:MAG: hypothetical protein IPJ72_05235 [Candidatus Peregrinibacteria bacterium]
MNELINAARNQENFELKTVYLVGPYAKMPSLKDALQAAFPQMEWKEMSYLTSQSLTSEYAIAGGLALWPLVGTKQEAQGINLLPTDKRDALQKKQTYPMLRNGLLGLFSVLTAFCSSRACQRPAAISS